MRFLSKCMIFHMEDKLIHLTKGIDVMKGIKT